MNQTTNPEILTVSELTEAIKAQLESKFPYVHLQGEISNFKAQSSGHYYFSLKDSLAQISVVMFKGAASLLKSMPKNGDHVVVKGELNIYPPKGNYQLVVRELSQVGLGELLQTLEQLKIKLHQRGWFRSVHKKALPKFPKIIGVVTSPTGAVIQDIINILTRRLGGFHLILNPVKVQGEGAAEEIAQAIEQFNTYPIADVLIVGRGGGSLEDLWPFNDERVATAIFNSRIPIISAVGHETDHCIADYVADVRAPTPSAAAEIVIADKKQHLDHLQVLQKRIRQALMHHIQQNQHKLKGMLRHPVFANPMLLLEKWMQQLDDRSIDIDQQIFRMLSTKKQKLEGRLHQARALNPTNQMMHLKNRLMIYESSFNHRILQELQLQRQKLRQYEEKLLQVWEKNQKKWHHLFEPNKIKSDLDQLVGNQIKSYRQKLIYQQELIQSIDPKNLLKKGYGILFAEKSNSVINSVYKLEQGQSARLLLSDGEALITINEVLSRELTPSL